MAMGSIRRLFYSRNYLIHQLSSKTPTLSHYQKCRTLSVEKEQLETKGGDLSSLKVASALFSAPQLDSDRQKVSRLYKLGKLNHVAVAVKDVQDAAELYEKVFEADVSKPVPHVEMGATVIFVRLGNTNIELMEPLGKASPIEKFLAGNNSGGIHHICLEVPSIEATIQRLRDNHVDMQTEEPVISDHGKRSVFVDPKDSNGVLLELMEETTAKGVSA
ncbi:methylmalonyl-CoA epimerase [Galdieria sulphuraria]|uniref:Methylmalonyl-CoA epimerase n=1 Tax=Galdieria sulphuraria TaxID=130081 RepID=M2W362_GALSU|nr:methylmalonyl-CoA epimerase [Galdieria sulphuraria]EME30141.1 methylmalonyl-CoA epimerase [Galdieria sulphuraria]|eukprot:XP_005706661.1 methylmalonyl-CoA epimerase [Galdieria sulphuraria]